MKEKLHKIIEETAKKLFEIETGKFVVDYPKDEKFGDYATNISLILAKKLGKSPMEVAGIFKEELEMDAC
jgi:arginyl-tRNA synthetase